MKTPKSEIFVFYLFFLFTSICVFPIFFIPVANTLIAKVSWEKTEGKILEPLREDFIEWVDENGVKRKEVRSVSEFHYEGKKYISTYGFFGQEIRSSDRGEEIKELGINSLRVGSSVNVYFNPSDPKESVLTLKITSFKTFGTLIGGLIWLMILNAVLRSEPLKLY